MNSVGGCVHLLGQVERTGGTRVNAGENMRVGLSRRGSLVRGLERIVLLADGPASVEMSDFSGNIANLDGSVGPEFDSGGDISHFGWLVLRPGSGAESCEY